jgi:diguanylate cyclase (GGDEF)-like protein
MVDRHAFRFEDKQFKLTISLGVAEVPLDTAVSTNDLLRRADENLFTAKRTGRNRVVS